MITEMDSPAFHTFALTATIVAVELILLAFVTGAVRTLSKTYTNPEDKAVIKGERADREAPGTERVIKAHRNAIENAVPFFLVGSLFVATGASASSAAIYCWTFLAARSLHAVFYLVGVQPFRTLSFGVGALCTLGMGAQVIMKVM